MRSRRSRRLALAGVAVTGVVVALAPAPASADPDCGVQAMAQPFIDHLQGAHLQTSAFQQAKDLMHADSYVLVHTELVQAMLDPLLPTAEGTIDPFMAHLDAAHLATSPFQQAAQAMHANDYVLAHTVLVEQMLAPVATGTGCPGEPAASPAMPGMPAPAPAPAPAPSGHMSHMPEPAPAPAAPASGATTVDMVDSLAFTPADITVPVGTSVTWVNTGSAPHTVVSRGAGNIKSKIIEKGQSYAHTFSTPGTYAYYCTVHPNMRGTVTVQ